MLRFLILALCVYCVHAAVIGGGCTRDDQDLNTVPGAAENLSSIHEGSLSRKKRCLLFGGLGFRGPRFNGGPRFVRPRFINRPLYPLFPRRIVRPIWPGGNGPRVFPVRNYRPFYPGGNRGQVPPPAPAPAPVPVPAPVAPMAPSNGAGRGNPNHINVVNVISGGNGGHGGNGGSGGSGGNGGNGGTVGGCRGDAGGRNGACKK